MKRYILTAVVAVVCTLLVVFGIRLVKGDRYMVHVSDTFQGATIATSTLSCQFGESSSFVKVQGQDLFTHSSGRDVDDPDGKYTVLTFNGLDSRDVAVTIDLLKADGPLHYLSVKKTADYILLANALPGDVDFFVLYPSQKVALWHSNTLDDTLVRSFDAMGFCH